MAFKSNINGQLRGFYFASSGDDDFSGQTVEVPKLTIQAAIDAAAGVSPPPSGGNIVFVTVSQGGSFRDESLVLVNSMEFSGMGVTLIDSVNTTTVTLASIVECRISAIANVVDNAICVQIDGEFIVAFSTAFISFTGDNSIGINITGTCDDIFMDISRLRIASAGGIGLKITSTQTSPLDLDFDSVGLEANNTTFVECDSPSIDDHTVISVSTINTNSFTGTTAFLVKSGHFGVESAGFIEASTVIKVESGAEMDINANTVTGDIIVDAGGILNAFIVDHESGIITENGIINGIINGVPFGTYRQKHEEQVVLNAFSTLDQTPSTTDTLLQIEFGAAQFGPTDPVQISAAGAITINQSDQYNLFVIFQYGRRGAAGGSTLLFFRTLIDGVQFGNSRYAELDNPNQAFPVEFSVPLNLVATNVLTIEIWRDSSGFDEGELLTRTPVLGGTNFAPSASITVTRNRNIQPV